MPVWRWIVTWEFATLLLQSTTLTPVSAVSSHFGLNAIGPMKKQSEEDKLDFLILRDGAVSMYHSLNVLHEDLDWFLDARYSIIDIDTSKWTPKIAHKDIKEKMGFPDYYGENMNAFKDCLRDIYPLDKRGLVIVLRHFDDFTYQDRGFAHALLDSIAKQSREWLLNGKRLICLVQSGDPDMEFDKVGGYNLLWNGREWFDAHRKK